VTTDPNTLVTTLYVKTACPPSPPATQPCSAWRGKPPPIITVTSSASTGTLRPS